MSPKLFIAYALLSALQPDPKNPRTHSQRQISQIARSLVEFGFIVPILVDSSYQIIAGHGRYLAAKRLKMAEVPIVVIDQVILFAASMHRRSANEILCEFVRQARCTQRWRFIIAKQEGPIMKVDIDHSQKRSMPMSDHDLSRFVEAQNGGVYDRVLRELSSGRKTSHSSLNAASAWTPFSQLKGLAAHARSPPATGARRALRISAVCSSK